MIRWRCVPPSSSPSPSPSLSPSPSPSVCLLFLLSLVSLVVLSPVVILAAETETHSETVTQTETLMEGQVEAIAAAEASMYAQAPSIEAHLYDSYMNLMEHEGSQSADITARGHAQMEAWVQGIQQELEQATKNNVAELSFLETGSEGETSVQSGAALSASITQQMDEQLEGQIRGMSQQELEQQAAIVDMLEADAADAREAGEVDETELLEVDHEQQAHADIHQGLRDAMSTEAGMETLHELRMEQAREEAVRRAETWLQGGVNTDDMSAIEMATDTDTDTASSTELDSYLGADATAEQLAAQEQRIWNSMSTEAKMMTRASMAIDLILHHTMEIHVMNQQAVTILDHLISDGYLHQGIEQQEGQDIEFMEMEQEMDEETRPKITTLTSCSLSASNHLRAPTSCSCPPPSVTVICTTEAPPSFHTSLRDTWDRITTLRTLMNEIQGVLGRAQHVMLEVQQHIELFRDGVGAGLRVEHDSLTDTLSEATHQLVGYEHEYSQSIDQQTWICTSRDGIRSFQGVPGTVRAIVTQLC